MIAAVSAAARAAVVRWTVFPPDAPAAARVAVAVRRAVLPLAAAAAARVAAAVRFVARAAPLLTVELVRR
jgi:hypothetical protein